MHFVAAEACQEEALPSTKVQQYSTSNLVMQSKLPIPTWDYVGLLHIQYNYVQDSEGYYETNPNSHMGFQSSNPIGQFIIHDYACICTIALTTP